MLWTRIEDQRVSVLFLATCALGLVTGAGVLQLQAWARQFVLACVGLLVFVTAILTPVILFFNFPTDSGIPDLPQRDRTMLVVVCFFAVVIGLWCARVLYEQAESFDTPRSPQPFSLAVIGAFLMLAGITGAVGLFNLQQPPTMTFGLVLTGWRAFAVLLFYSAISLSLGFGLLNQNEESRKLAIYYALFQVLNNGAFLLRPGRQRAVETFYEERLNYNPAWAVHLPVEGLSAFLRCWAIESCIMALLAIWFLVEADSSGMVPKANPSTE